MMVRAILGGLLLVACSAVPSSSEVPPDSTTPTRSPDTTPPTTGTPVAGRGFTVVWIEGERSPDSFTRSQTYTVEGSRVRAVLRFEGSDNHRQPGEADRDVDYTLSDEARIDAALESFEAIPSSGVAPRPNEEVYGYIRGCLARPGGVERCFEGARTKMRDAEDAKALAALRDALWAELVASEGSPR